MELALGVLDQISSSKSLGIGDKTTKQGIHVFTELNNLLADGQAPDYLRPLWEKAMDSFPGRELSPAHVRRME